MLLILWLTIACVLIGIIDGSASVPSFMTWSNSVVANSSTGSGSSHLGIACGMRLLVALPR